MAENDERLVVALEARIRDFERNFQRAQATASRSFNSIEQRARQSSNRLQSIMAASSSRLALMVRNVGVGLAAGLSARALQGLSDAATRIENALKAAGLSGEELESVYGRLRESAIRNAAPLESLVTLYGRAAIVQKELGVTTQELLGFTDNVALALRVAGTDAGAASGALLQLSQALGSGTVRAEEFNSILEGALPIAQAAAAGLKEAGGSVATLRQLVVDGKVSSEAFFRAFEAGSATLRDKVAGSTLTVSQAMSNLYTALIDTAREFNTSTGAAEKFAGGVNNVATAIADLDVSAFVEKLTNAHGALVRFMNELGNADAFVALNQALGLMDENGNVINLDAKAAKDEATALEREVNLLQATIAKNTELGFDNTEALARLDQVSARLAQVRAQAANMPATVPAVSDEKARQIMNEAVPFNPLPAISAAPKQVSLADFAPPASSGGGSKGGGSGSTRQDDYQREIAQIRERTAALQAETAAQAGINPLVDDFEFAITKARAARELLSAAEEAGIAITPEVQSSIDQLANGYATATAEANRLADAQDKTRDRAQAIGNFGKDVLGGFISDLRAGRTASEALANSLNKIADKLLDIGLNSLFGDGFLSGLFGGGNVVSFGSIIGLANGGPVSGPGGPRDDKVPAMLSDGEYVVNAAATAKHRPLLDAINTGAVARLADGGPVGSDNRSIMLASAQPADVAQSIQINAPVTVNGSAGTPAQNDDLAKQIGRQLEATMRGVVVDELRAQMRPGNALNLR
jgi:tape measure domain-containing protein